MCTTVLFQKNLRACWHNIHKYNVGLIFFFGFKNVVDSYDYKN